MGLHTILEATGEHPHLQELLDERDHASGGISEEDYDEFAFAIFRELERRIHEKIAGHAITAAGLREAVHASIEEMRQE